MQLPVLPPGTILQHLYRKERLRRIKPGYFLEVGCGRGYVSKVLLDLGWYGIGYDLNPKSLDYALSLNHTAVSTGRFRVKNQNFFREFQVSNANIESLIELMVPLTLNLANRAIVNSTISLLLETTLDWRRNLANQ
jgi:SAM-dependent methyltransferase